MKAKILQRVLAEAKQINADFFNLRTVISLDPEDDASNFYFMMLPNDGAMAHLTLVGSFYIPEEYPEAPPVVRLYTPTRRYNVDVFRYNYASKTRSTMCFDILRSQAHGGTWRPEYTLSCLFASLMSAIVSFYVAQEYGGEFPEYVTMEKLESVKSEAEKTYQRYKNRLPPVPRVPLVEATAVPATPLFEPQELIAGHPEMLTSKPILLQTGSDEVYSFAVDLSRLHKDVVFSVVLSNSLTDLVGRQKDTILVRNGVTATAGRKRAGQNMMWFYHGKPMNDGEMMLHVTIGRDQMTFAYYEDDRLYVHGDCPVSRLSAEDIGDVRGVPFYVHVYTRNKKGKLGEPVRIDILDIAGEGYIHESADGEQSKDYGIELVKPENVRESPEVAVVKEERGEAVEWDDGLMGGMSGLQLD